MLQNMRTNYDFATVERLSIHHRFAERPGAPKLLLTGAWPQSIHCWEPAWAPLCERFSVLALDLPGFGRSEGRADLMCPSEQARFVGRALRHFGHEGAWAVMPDVGVPIGLYLLEREPTLLVGATFANGPCTYPLLGSVGLRALVHSSIVRQAVAFSPRTFVETALRNGYCVFQPTRALTETYADCYRGGRLDATLAYLASYPRELPTIHDALTTIAAPVTMVWGERDPFLSVENARLLGARVPRCTVELLPNAGHFSHEDAHERLVEILLRDVHGTLRAPPPSAETGATSGALRRA